MPMGYRGAGPKRLWRASVAARRAARRPRTGRRLVAATSLRPRPATAWRAGIAPTSGRVSHRSEQGRAHYIKGALTSW